MVEEDKGTKVKLFVLYDGYATVEGFHEYLIDKVPQNAKKFTVIPKPSEECNGGTGFEVEFESKNKAKQSFAKLRKVKELRVSLTESYFQSVQSEINDFILSLQRNRGSLLVNIEDKINTLKLDILSLPTRCALDEYEKLTQQKNIIKQQIEEHELQIKEFDEYCNNILTELKRIQTSDQLNDKSTEDRIIKLQAKFGIECHRISKALPMYARRQKILSTIRENQVSILIGETGSGKSTQLVQYLYDAGVASDGIIVCTQPRKVAAISLANHVSREMCVKLGDELGYKSGMLGKYSDKTKILYMTDHALLNECIKDKNFTKYSCLVIDEAHERSLHTDLLLSFVKKCLLSRKDLRVVITSATIDPDIFVKYFVHCPVIRVPGRAYPVETVWSPIKSQAEIPTMDEYILNAVELVSTIHTKEGPGDVLVFLTSPGEVDIACQFASENLEKKSSIVLPLHGKMQPVDQQKVFQEYDGKRKVIFCTNVAETSVTIDGVKFVIDTGMAKEMHFDPKRNMNLLEVCRISKSSAEQRKGRAGRTSPGKCFRLYPKEIYDNMRDRMLPELLRVHLTLAVLKLYEFGVEDVLEFEFVEQPDSSTLREAVKILKFVDAISDTGLTDRGKILASLPIDPQLGKAFLDGVEAGVGLEAAIVVAASAVGGGIFFRAGTDAEKAASDKKKLQFCHEAGDQMTSLCVYWNWVSQHKEARNQWCFANSINAKSMRRVEETVKELLKIALTHAIKIPTALRDLKSAEAHLPKIFFFSFLNNIAVFTGHERAGYILSENQTDPSFVFPGSVLSSQNLVPQYLVYEKVLKTSRQFLLQVMPVKPEWIKEAVSIGKLPLDPAERFKEYMVSAVTLPHVGWQMFKKAYIESDKIKQELKEVCQNSPHSVDTTTTKITGVVNLYTQSRHHEHARSLLEKRFDEIRKELEKEQHEIGVTAESDDVRLVLGHGGQIQHVLMPGDCMTVFIKGPHLNTEWTKSVLKKLTCHGEVCSVTSKSFKKNHMMFIRYYDPMDAADAVAVLSECYSMDKDGITVELNKKQMGTQCVTTLQVEWCRRMRQEFAFINFDEPMDATRLLVHSHPHYRFKRDKNVYPSQLSYKVFVTNVPITHTEEDLERAVNYRLSIDSVAPNSNFTVQLGYQKPFSTNPEEAYRLKCGLKILIDKYTQSNKYEMKMISPECHYKTYRAFVNIKDVSEYQKIFDGLGNECINGHPLMVKPQLSSAVVFSYKVFSVIKVDVERIKVALEHHYKNILSIKKVDDDNNVKYMLKSEDMQAYIDAKQMLSGTMVPTIKDCRFQPVLCQFVLSNYCQEIMNNIQQRTSTVITINKRMLAINVYGTEENKAKALKLIEDHLNKLLQSDVQNFDIPLKKPGGPPGLMKQVVSRFGLDLEKLVQKEGISGAVLNVNKHVLSVSSTPEAYKSLLEEIESFASRGDVHLTQNQEVVECCVCWTELNSESEIFRLEYCGHSYCIECIKIQVTFTTAVFPLICAADQCSQPLVIQDFNALCKRVSYTMRELCEASLRSYISVNSDKVRNCSTPDCKMIYTVSEVGEKFFCSLCGISICTKCHVQYHDNLTCAMYQSLKREDSSIQKWIMEDSKNRKCCPKCKLGIEKTGGCNHVSCKCGVHICWVCLEYFDDSQQCYGHLQASHGSFA